MEFSVVGSQEFTLGFQLAGISNIFNPETDEEKSALEKAPDYFWTCMIRGGWT